MGAGCEYLILLPVALMVLIISVAIIVLVVIGGILMLAILHNSPPPVFVKPEYDAPFAAMGSPKVGPGLAR